MAEDFIGIISDTHGFLRPEAVEALQGATRIIHAGDVGSAAVLEGLSALAPVVAVRGNVDHGAWADALPLTAVVEVGDALLYVLHDIKQLDLVPQAAGFSAVISGHSHRPSAVHRDGVLYLNPGSAGRRRFDLPIMVARLWLRGQTAEAELVELPVRS